MIADGHVKTTNTGSSGDALLVVGGGKAYFNGGVTSVVGRNNAYYSVGVINRDSQLHVTGTTNVISPDNIGYGLYLGSETTNSFNGETNIYAGKYGLSTFGRNSFNGQLNITMTGSNMVALYSGNNSPLAETNFNGLVNLKINPSSDNTVSSYGVVNVNVNNTLNLNEGAKIIYGDDYSTGFKNAVYSSGGKINIKGPLDIYTRSGGAVQSALSAIRSGQISVTDSVVNIKGDFYASGLGKIDLDAKAGSQWMGASYQADTGIINIKAKKMDWLMTDSSILTNLDLINSSVIFNSSLNQPFTLLVDTLKGDGSLFTMNADLGRINSPINAKGERVGEAGVHGDLLKVKDDLSGQHRLTVENNGASTTQGNEVLQMISTGPNVSGNFTLTNTVELGGYEYLLRPSDDGAGNKIGWELFPKKKVTKTVEVGVGGFFNAGYLLTYIDTQTLLQRMGELRDQSRNEGNTWVRGFGGHLHSYSGQKISGFSMGYAGGQIGVDQRFARGDDDLYVGLMGGYTEANPDYRTGSGTVKNYHVGGYVSYLMNNGFYIDGNIKHSRISNKFSVTDTQNNLVSGSNRGVGYGVSLEAGRRFDFFEDRFYFEPQMQVSYFYQQGNQINASNGLKIHFSHYDSVLGRVSTILGYKINQGEKSSTHLYTKLGAVREFDGASYYYLNNHRENYTFKGNWFDGALGFSSSINNKHNVYGELGYARGNRFDKNQLNLGYRYTF